MREKWHSGEECILSMSQNTFQLIQMMAWERSTEELQLTVSSACAMHNMPVYQLTVLKNVLISYTTCSCLVWIGLPNMSWISSIMCKRLEMDMHVSEVVAVHEDMTFHISVSVNTHNSIMWSTENSHVLWIWNVQNCGRKNCKV